MFPIIPEAFHNKAIFSKKQIPLTLYDQALFIKRESNRPRFTFLQITNHNISLSKAIVFCHSYCSTPFILARSLLKDTKATSFLQEQSYSFITQMQRYKPV